MKEEVGGHSRRSSLSRAPVSSPPSARPLRRLEGGPARDDDVSEFVPYDTICSNDLKSFERSRRIVQTIR